MFFFFDGFPKTSPYPRIATFISDNFSMFLVLHYRVCYIIVHFLTLYVGLDMIWVIMEMEAENPSEVSFSVKDFSGTLIIFVLNFSCLVRLSLVEIKVKKN